jgi:hypothetical protein
MSISAGMRPSADRSALAAERFLRRFADGSPGRETRDERPARSGERRIRQ